MATYTNAQYDALVKALATGARRVQYGDQDITYRSLAEMERLKKKMEIDLGLTTAKPGIGTFQFERDE